MRLSEEKKEISSEGLKALTERAGRKIIADIAEKKRPEKILILPPDITRIHSMGGKIAEHLYYHLSKICSVYLMPALGQHKAHTEAENRLMYGSVPENRILKHDPVGDTVKIGTIPAEYVKKITDGKADIEIPVELNRILFDEKWDMIVNIGQIVPHEVFGFSGYNKNFFIGLGGTGTIASSHIASACCGIENIMGKIVSPIRKLFNNAQYNFLDLPMAYILLVMAEEEERLLHKGFYCGRDFETYIEAAELSSKLNITKTAPLKKAVAYMDPKEFKSAWTANKAIYRLRKAMADGGELIIIAPGMERFGETPETDSIIRKYGYCGTKRIMGLMKSDKELKRNAHAAAHLIHGSSEGRFKIRYAVKKLSQKEIEGTGMGYADYDTAINRYPPDKMKNGTNITSGGEEVFFTRNPSSGLWIAG